MMEMCLCGAQDMIGTKDWSIVTEFNPKLWDMLSPTNNYAMNLLTDDLLINLK